METEPLCQQITHEQVAGIIERFYAAVLRDELLAGYFSHIDNWPEHCRHITDFWWSVLGGKVDNPRPHAMERGHRDLLFGKQELGRWLALFSKTLHASLPQEQADRWFALARQIGDRMSERGLLGQ